MTQVSTIRHLERCFFFFLQLWSSFILLFYLRIWCTTRIPSKNARVL